MTARCARTLRQTPLLGAAFLLLLAASAAAQPSARPPAPPAPPLPMARQIAVREGWLARRYEMLLRMMRARKRRHVDRRQRGVPRRSARPQLVAPPRPYVGRRDIFVFTDARRGRPRRGWPSPATPKRTCSGSSTRRTSRLPPAKALADLVAKYSPTTHRPRRSAAPAASRTASRTTPTSSSSAPSARRPRSASCRPSRSSRSSSTRASQRRRRTTRCWSSGPSTSPAARSRTR